MSLRLYLANTQQVYQHMNGATAEVTHHRKEASHETTKRTHYMHLHESTSMAMNAGTHTLTVFSLDISLTQQCCN